MPPRRFIYLLRKVPAHKIIRGLHQYNPQETLQNAAPEPGMPGPPRAPR